MSVGEGGGGKVGRRGSEGWREGEGRLEGRGVKVGRRGSEGWRERE